MRRPRRDGVLLCSPQARSKTRLGWLLGDEADLITRARSSDSIDHLSTDMDTIETPPASLTEGWVQLTADEARIINLSRANDSTEGVLNMLADIDTRRVVASLSGS